MKIVKEEELITKYEGATAIYALQRRKKLSKKEKVFDWAVALFSPLPGIVDEADMVADVGAYFWVQNASKDILVRVENGEVVEEDMTGKVNKKNDKVILYDGNQYAVFKELISGKTFFTLNI